MTEKDFFLIFTVAALIPAFQILVCRLMHPTRMKLARIGKKLLANKSISSEQKDFIESTLNDAYDWKKAIFLALFATPISIYVIISKMIGANIRQPNSPFTQLRSLPSGEDFLDQYMKCMLGSNPVASFLALLQIIPVIIGLSIVLRGFRRANRIVEEHVLGHIATAKKI